MAGTSVVAQTAGGGAGQGGGVPAGVGTWLAALITAFEQAGGTLNGNLAVGAFSGFDSNGIRVPALPGVSLPLGWDTVWRAAKANVATSPALITCLDASVGYGRSASANLTTAWQPLVEAALVANLGTTVYGELHLPLMSSDFVNTWQGANPWRVFGGPTEGLGGFTSYPEYAGSSATFPLLTYQPQTAVVTNGAIDIWYRDDLSGTWDYALDGGSRSTITQTNSGTTKVLTLSGLSAGLHSVNLGNISAGNMFRVFGGTVYPYGKSGVGGIGMARCCMPSAGLAKNLGATATTPTDPCLTFQAANWPASPHLLIIGALSDMGSGYGVQTTARVLDRLLKAARRGRQNCSVLLVVPAICGDYSDTDQGSWLYYESWILLRRMITDMQAAFNCAYIDFTQLWSCLGFTNGYQPNNDVHPLDAGHANMASVIGSVL